MKSAVLQEKSVQELQKLLQEKRKTLRLFRFALAGSKTKNVKEGRNVRKDIARILSILNNTK